MKRENIEDNFDLEEFKKIKEQIINIKGNCEIALKENKLENEKIKNKFSLKKVIGIIALIILLFSLLSIIILNLNIILLPKNSITITVTDQNKKVINNLQLRLDNKNNTYYLNFIDKPNITKLDMEAGTYELVFENVPDDYNCDVLYDNFLLKKDGKINIKYECIKNN